MKHANRIGSNRSSHAITASFFLAAFLLLIPLAVIPQAASDRARNTQFKPGKVWLDTSGQPINAHGGGMLYYAGKYWFMGSGCTGWDPNPARSAVADSIWGPWTELGNPCRGRGAKRTFGGQSTFVFPVAGQTNAFIFMADRWKKTRLPGSRYLWLPLQFNPRGFQVTWRGAWDLKDLEASLEPVSP